MDGGLETNRLEMPAIISTDLRLNEPRYASLPNIMKAKKKPMDLLKLEDLDVDVIRHQTILEVTPPVARSAGVMVATVDELVDKLKNDANVL